jgi:galactokinase
VSITIDAAVRAFEEHFDSAPSVIVRAPGRVSLMGGHVDYNGGRVLPMAINRDTVVAAAPNGRDELRLCSMNLLGKPTVPLDARERVAETPWADYAVGVLAELSKLGHPIAGADLLVWGDVPIGSGLSSSASLEMALLKAFESLNGFEMDAAEAAKLGRRVENEFLGLKSGIMDQFVSRAATAGQALLLDCATLQYEDVPVAFADSVFVITDSCKERTLAGSKYNERVAECAEALRLLNERHGRGAQHLAEYQPEDVDAAADALGDVIHRRARHATTEIRRVGRAVEILRTGDATAYGALMCESHASLRDDYEVTCGELDELYGVASKAPGWIGGRLTGAGFGGCLVHLVQKEMADDFVRHVREVYLPALPREDRAFVVEPVAGAERLR